MYIQYRGIAGTKVFRSTMSSGSGACSPDMFAHLSSEMHSDQILRQNKMGRVMLNPGYCYSFPETRLLYYKAVWQS